MTKVKVFCHCCKGAKHLVDTAYPSRKDVKVICPECNGKGWVWEDKYEGVEK